MFVVPTPPEHVTGFGFALISAALAPVTVTESSTVE
jgi:hypothetical protein